MKKYKPAVKQSDQASVIPNKALSAKTELFIKLLYAGQKIFKGMDLSMVQFGEINRKIFMKNNQLAKTRMFQGLDFSGANLQGAQLSHLDFSNSNFSAACLKNANLSNAIFKSTDLSYADLSYAILSGTDLSQSNLSYAILLNIQAIHTKLKSSNLTQANLIHAQLIESDFSGGDLSDALFDFAKLERSDFFQTDLSHSSLFSARLMESFCVESNFNNADLRRSNLAAANLMGAHLQDAQLSLADLREANFADADLSGANLEESYLYRTDFRRAYLNNTCLDRSEMIETNLRGAYLINASLSTQIAEIELKYTHLEGATGSFTRWEDYNHFRYHKEQIVNAPEPKMNDRSIGLDLLSRCLPSNSPSKKDCKISWANVSHFAAKGHDTCDAKQIVIDSQFFLRDILSQDEATQTEWLHVANVVTLSGKEHEQNLVKDLIYFQILASLLSEQMERLAITSSQLKTSLITQITPMHKPSSLELLDQDRGLPNLTGINNEPLLLNTTLFDLDTLVFQEQNAALDYDEGYAIGLNFLSSGVREFLEKIQSIFIYTTPSPTAFIYVFDLKPNKIFIEQKHIWLGGLLNNTQYSKLMDQYAEIYSQNISSIQNISLTNSDLIRYTVIQLLRIPQIYQPFVHFNQNVTAIQPYKTVMRFKDGIELMLDDKKNIFGYVNSSQSLSKIIQTYANIAQRLNIAFIITQSTTKEVVAISHSKNPEMQNLVHPSYLVANGNEKNFVIRSGFTKLNLAKFPLKEVVIYASNKEQCNSLDFHNLTHQINEDLKAILAIELLAADMDLIFNCFLQFPNQQKRSVVSVRLTDALNNHGYKNFKIILDHHPLKIIRYGLKMYLEPLPLQLNETNTTDFIRLETFDKNMAILIPKTIDSYAFVRIEDDLILTNIFGSSLEKLYHLVLQDFYQDPLKGMTYTLEFINKKIVLNNQRTEIFNLVAGWNNTYYEHKKNLFTKASQIAWQRKRPGRIFSDKECYQPEYFSIDSWNRWRRSILAHEFSPAEITFQTEKTISSESGAIPTVWGVVGGGALVMSLTTLAYFSIRYFRGGHASSLATAVIPLIPLQQTEATKPAIQRKNDTQGLLDDARMQAQLKQWQYEVAMEQFRQRSHEIGLVYLGEHYLLHTTMGDYFKAVGLTPNWHQHDPGHLFRRIVRSIQSSNLFRSHQGRTISAVCLETALLYPSIQAVLPEDSYRSKLVVRFIADLLQFGPSTSSCVPSLVEFLTYQHPWNYPLVMGLRGALSMLEVINDPSTWYLVAGLFILPQLPYVLENLGIPVTRYINHALEILERLFISCSLLMSVQADSQRLENKEMALQAADQRVNQGRVRIAYALNSMGFFKSPKTNNFQPEQHRMVMGR